MENQTFNLTEVTADIASSYVSKNTVPASDVPQLLSSIHEVLAALGEDGPEAPQEPAVPIKKAVTPSYVTCLECGAKYKSLKRHLGSLHGLTPEEYRQKWNLGSDFLMVAPEYSKRRAETAKRMGLGRKTRKR